MTGPPAFCCILLGWDNSFVLIEDDERGDYCGYIAAKIKFSETEVGQWWWIKKGEGSFGPLLCSHAARYDMMSGKQHIVL